MINLVYVCLYIYKFSHIFRHLLFSLFFLNNFFYYFELV